jgi:ribose 5-phosphate isomerase A
MNAISHLKKSAAEFAVNEFVRSNMIVGLGTGSTAIFALYKIAELLKQGILKNVKGIPSSNQIEMEAKSLGIPLTDLNEHQIIDVTIDGADEVDPDMNLIKGGGGALLREKIIAQASKREIIVVDDKKLSEKLGTKWPVPIEVIPFGWESQAEFVKSIGANPSLRKIDSGMPFTTDQGNYILDLHIGPINNLISFTETLNSRAGIVEHGLFINIATDLVIASEQDIQHKTK